VQDKYIVPEKCTVMRLELRVNARC